MRGKKILVTGGTGTVGRPVAESLAAENEVWVLGRFGEPGVREALESKGIRTHVWDLREPLGDLPGGFTHVFHAALGKEIHDWQEAIDVHAGAAARLMLHCRDAEAFLMVSTGGVYRHLEPDHPHLETDPLGGTTPYFPAYSTQKVGTEAVVRGLSQALGLPSVIARLSVTYGEYGWGSLPIVYYRLLSEGKPIPMPPGGTENYFMPLHTDDVARQSPLLWDVASVPAQVVNWGGDDAVSNRALVDYVAELSGFEPLYEESESYFASPRFDNAKRLALIGSCEIGWREGIRRALEAQVPGSTTRAAGRA